MSHRGDSSLGSIFIYFRFVVFPASRDTLMADAGAQSKAVFSKERWEADGRRPQEDAGAADDQKPPSSEAQRHSHRFQGHIQALSRKISCFQEESCSSLKQEVIQDIRRTMDGHAASLREGLEVPGQQDLTSVHL